MNLNSMIPLRLLRAATVLLLLLVGCERPTPVPASPTTRPPVILDNFQAGPNRFNGASHCDAQNGATFECAPENETLRLTYAQVGGGAYAIWWIELRGADLSGQLLLAIRVRGARGGERPHIYLEDGNGTRAYVELARYQVASPDWNTIFVPLQDFRDRNGSRPDLAHLKALAIAFEFEKQAGTLYIGEIRAQASPVVGRLSHDRPRESTLSNSIQVPAGFKVSVHADLHLPEITRIGFDAQGRLTFTRRSGQAYLVENDQLKLIASGFDELLGFAWHDRELYLSSCRRVTRARDEDRDGFYEHATDLLNDLPCAGHQTNGLVFGPDGWLYVSQGEFNNQPGTLLRMHVDSGGKPEVYATGLRNMYAFTFTLGGEIFGTDNGPDDKDGPEEFNQIVQGGDYGFPRYFGVPPPGSGTRAPLATFPQHAAAEGIVRYDAAQFPAAANVPVHRPGLAERRYSVWDHG